MTQEEKARAYDEVLGRAKEKYAMFEGMKQGDVLEDVFPELKESGDERIRKAIYNCVKWFGFDSCFFKDVSQEECLAWIEKQCEKGTNGNERKTSIPEPPLTIKHAKEVMGIKQDDAWSEEDNINCKRLLYFLDGGHLMHDHNIELSIWLKHLKDRVLPQPQWSKMDDVRLTSTIEVLEFAYSLDSYNQYGKEDIRNNLSWLKSLKDRVQPQPSKERSEKDETALSDAL